MPKSKITDYLGKYLPPPNSVKDPIMRSNKEIHKMKNLNVFLEKNFYFGPVPAKTNQLPNPLSKIGRILKKDY